VNAALTITNVLRANKQRVDSKNGNGDGLIDYNEFLPWYTAMAEKHYKFMTANEQIESPKIEKKSPSFQRSAPPPPVRNIYLPLPSHCLPFKIILVLLSESPACPSPLSASSLILPQSFNTFVRGKERRASDLCTQ
jgi:hypothetical protein